MSIRITQIHLSESVREHEHITDVKWANRETGVEGQSARAAIVEWIDVKRGEAFVGTGGTQVRVGTIHPTSSEPYLRTYADGSWTNNLLSLDEF
jgi:Protein of unknown function (DUF3892)